MNPHKKAIIRAFICPLRRRRWLESLASSKQHNQMLDRLNHCRDIDERFSTMLPSNANVIAILKAHGAAATCYVLSDSPELDGQEMSLDAALEQAAMNGFGTIISCLPGHLAYYYDECGERCMLLER